MSEKIEIPAEALHASVPKDHKCSDCTMDKVPCPFCYIAWWRYAHPNVHFIQNLREALTHER